MSPSRGAVGTGFAVAGALVGGATAVGAMARERTRQRRALSSLVEPEAYQRPPTRVVQVVAEDGVRLHVEVDEPDELDGRRDRVRPTVVLCHGYTLSLQSWVLQARALTRNGYRVVLWDLRGHGSSERGPALSHDIGQLARDLRLIIDEVVPEGPVALVGHSMGGMTIMALGGHDPAFVRSRVVAAAFVGTSAGGGRLLSIGYGEAIGALVSRVGPGLLGHLATRRGIFDGVRRLGRDLESYVVERYSFGSPVAPETVRFASDMIFATPLDVMADFLPALDRLDERTSLEAYRGIESLVINGDRDRLTPPEHSLDIVRHLPGAEHVVVTEAGHLIQIEHPHVVNEQLLDLLDRSVRAAEAGIDVRTKPRVRRTLTDLARRRRVSRAKEVS